MESEEIKEEHVLLLGGLKIWLAFLVILRSSQNERSAGDFFYFFNVVPSLFSSLPIIWARRLFLESDQFIPLLYPSVAPQ